MEPKIKSGQICTWNSLYRAFGRYRALIKVPPRGGQYWFSMWLIGKECEEEIDVFEFMGEDSKRFTVTLHAMIEGKKQIVFSKHFNTGVDLSKDFHLYEVDWQSNYIDWYLDGVKLCRYGGKHIPIKPMGLIINNAVSRGFNPDGIPESKLKELFPAKGTVKWLEVLRVVFYQRKFEWCNAVLFLLFIHKRFIGHFKKSPSSSFDITFYAAILFDFRLMVDRRYFLPCEHWGCTKDGDNPYIIWKDEQRVQTHQGLDLITDINKEK